MTVYHTTDLDPDTYHDRRRLADGKILAGTSYEVRAAIARTLCSCCRLGMPMTSRTTERGVITEHHPDADHTYPCKAVKFADEFLSLVRFWESTQEAKETT